MSDNGMVCLGRRWKRFYLLKLAIIACVQLAVSGCDDAQKTDQKATSQRSLTMGTSADMPPFEFYQTGNEGAQIVGYDVDLARAIGQELKADIHIKEMDFSALIAALQAGRVDFVMSSMTPTPERKKNIDFSQSYISFGITAVTQEPLTVQSVSDLKGKKIGVQLGSTFEQLAQQWAQNDPTISVVALNKLGELIQELIVGRIDVVLMERVAASSYIKLAPHLKNNALPQYEIEFAIAFAKGSPWVEKFNQALDQLKRSGQLEHLKKKWLSKD